MRAGATREREGRERAQADAPHSITGGYLNEFVRRREVRYTDWSLFETLVDRTVA